MSVQFLSLSLCSLRLSSWCSESLTMHVQFRPQNWTQFELACWTEQWSPIAYSPCMKWRKRISWSSGAYEYHLGRHSWWTTAWQAPTWSDCSSKSLNAYKLRINLFFCCFRFSLRTWAAAALTWAEGDISREPLTYKIGNGYTAHTPIAI